MKLPTKKRFVQRIAAWAMCGMLFQISSCNPNVRDAVISGLETTSLSLANIVITTLFQGLGDDPTASPA
jgi:hypothetical protein